MLDRISPKRNLKENHPMIDTTALIIAAFGTGSLVLSFVEYTLSRRKKMPQQTNPKNSYRTKASACFPFF